MTASETFIKQARDGAQRIVVDGKLRLTAPTHLGGGDDGNLADMALVRDSAEGYPLLAGTSIAGALRSYLRAWQQGHSKAEPGREEGGEGLAETLLGGTQADPDGAQSPLIIEDSLGALAPVEIRDGVAIDGATRTARDQKKYDLELLPAGMTFDLTFELLVPDDKELADYLRAILALALRALAEGEIGIGARNTRGYGACTVDRWKVTAYTMSNAADLLAYLAADHTDEPDWEMYAPTDVVEGDDIVALLKATLPPYPPGKLEPIHDTRQTFTLRATCALASPLLIRADEAEVPGAVQPDATHIRARDLSASDPTLRHPVLPGTSLAGALRARATRITNTLERGNQGPAKKLIEDLFGPLMVGEDDRARARASRLRVSERPIADAMSLVQNRVAIDRFTGGAADTALFAEAPLVAGTVEIVITIRDPQCAEIGLVLLLLKDLWTGDLPLGGASSIGRGRLRGICAELATPEVGWESSITGPEGTSAVILKAQTWRLTTDAAGALAVEGDRKALQSCVDALRAALLGQGGCQ